MKTLNRETFLEHVRKSRIPSVDKLDDWLAENPSTDPAELASAMVRDGLLTRWQAKYLLSGRHVLMIDNCQLLERIQRDAWGDLFLAEQRQLSRIVQIRFLPASISQDETVRNRFLDRVRKTAELDHPNIVHVMDVDHHKGRFFLVTEHVDASAAAEYSFDGAALAKLVTQAIDALSFIHDAGVEHGAIDESALLITRDGELKLNNLVTLASEPETPGRGPENDFRMLVETAIRIGQKIKDDPTASAVVESLQSFLKGEIDVQGLREATRRLASEQPTPLDELNLAPVFDRPPVTQQKSLAGLPLEKKQPVAPPPRPKTKQAPGFLKRINPVALVTGIVVVSLVLLGFTIYAATTYLSPGVARNKDSAVGEEKPRAAAVRPKPPQPELMGGRLDNLDPDQPIQERVERIPAKPADESLTPPANPEELAASQTG